MSVAAYYESLSKAYNPKSDSEHTHRSKLEALLNDTLNELRLAKDYRVVHEGKRVGSFGTPDFRVLEKASEAPIGYVENKEIGTNMDAVLKSDQIKKYITLSGNLLVTDYLEFVLIQKDRPVRRERLAHASDLDNKRFKLGAERISAVESLLNDFLHQEPEAVSDAKSLARALAVRSKELHDLYLEDLNIQLKDSEKKGLLFELFKVFRENVSSELTPSEFADAFAQMTSYGLFLAFLNSQDPKQLTLRSATDLIPKSMMLIREMVKFLKDIEDDESSAIHWIVSEILTILRRLDLYTLQSTLSYRTHQAKVKLGYSVPDPYLYFYEDFLAVYDKDTKVDRGVFYTPPTVVKYIVNGIDEILKEKFNIKEGWANRTVTALDFATGTGTFLLEAIRLILNKVGAAKKIQYIEDHILKNLSGFEYLIAPYTIAHMKISQFLKEEGYEPNIKNANARLRIFLTNTLDDKRELMPNLFVKALSNEGRLAQEVKNSEILVIMGNPPYYAKSKNNGAWIKDQVSKYKYLHGVKMKERNPKALNDDYVKFIRFAQIKMDQYDKGVVGIIANNGFLNNPTFVGMRVSLMQSFDQIYILDLNGDIAKSKGLDKKDENVFPIGKGVCVCFFIKTGSSERKVMFNTLYGEKAMKYNFCNDNSIANSSMQEIVPSAPYYNFLPLDLREQSKYLYFTSVKEIFQATSVGLATGDDSKYVTFRALANSIPIQFRPFDYRYIQYGGNLQRPRLKIMKHMLSPNVALVTSRSNKSQIMDHFLVTNTISELKTGESTTNSSIFPLYQYNNESSLFVSKVENFTSEFRKKVDALYGRRTPEDLLGYIYAVLHSPSYREKYRDFLKSDFPRIPFTEDVAEFDRLSALGRALYEAHLMQRNTPPAYEALGTYTALQTDTPTVDKPTYAAPSPAQATGRLYIHPGGPYFDNVPEPVYQFHIGGYQVLAKYLKDRKGRKLSLDEIENIEKVVKILAYTRDVMEEIG